MGSGSRLGYAGTGTGGAPNTKAIMSRPDIAGSSDFKYRPRNTGIKIKMARAKVKTSIKNPKI